MRRTAATLTLILPLLAPAGAQAQQNEARQNEIGGEAEERLDDLDDRMGGGVDDLLDPDLLDPDLGGDLLNDPLLQTAPPAAELPPGIAVPDDPTKQRVDGAAVELGAGADAAGEELYEELRALFERDPEAAKAQQARRLAQLEAQLSSMRTEIDQLMAGEGGDVRLRRQRGYGAPVLPERVRGRAPAGTLHGRRIDGDPLGRPMWDWWQDLLAATLRHASPQLHPLAAARIGALKTAGDRLALSVAPHLRPYVDHVVVREVAGSALGRYAVNPPYDRRLDDLFQLGRGATQPGTGAAASGSQGEQPAAVAERPLDLSIPQGGVEVKLLPRVRDPRTGQERVIVDLPLGAPPAGSVR